MAGDEGTSDEALAEAPAEEPTTTLAVRGVAGPMTVVLTKTGVGGTLSTEVVMPVGLTATDGQAEVVRLIAKGETEEAVTAAKQCLEKCGDVAEKDTEQVLAMITVSRAYLANNEVLEALLTAEDAAKKCEVMDDGVLEAKTLLTVAECHRTAGNMAEAAKVLRSALASFEIVEGGDQHHLSVASTLLSTVVLAQGEVDEGLDLAERGRELARGAGEQEQMVLLSVAEAYSAGRQPDEALAVAQEALSLAEEAGNKPAQVYALSTLASLHRKCDAFPQALVVCKQMRTLCHSQKNFEGEAYALMETSDVHLAEHQGKLATKAALAAVKLCLKEGKAGLRVPALLKVVEANMQLVQDYRKAFLVSTKVQKEFDTAAGKAFEAAQEAAKVAERVEDPSLRASAQYWLARAFLVVGKKQEALEAAGKAVFLFNRLGMKEREGDATLVAAEAHHAIDSTKKWAANACYDALDIFMKLGLEEARERAYEVMQELGIALRVVGTGMALPAAGDGAAATAAAAGAPAAGAGASIAEVKPKGLDEEMVTATVQEMAKAAIGLEDAVFLDSPLMDSGMDSLTAVSFRNGLQQQLGVKLPSSLMFDYPTMKEVANRIVELSLEDE